MQVTERIGNDRAWIGTALAAVAALTVGSAAFPRTVYDGFIWHYFWGPVFADANNAVCAVKGGGTTELLYGQGACSSAAAEGLIVAEPGYTPVSEVGYMVVLLFMLVGVLLLLRRLNIAKDRGLFFALVPFMLFGGALRVVEDGFDAVPANVEPAVTYPLNTLIISPVIYFTVFVITLAALLASLRLERAGVVGNAYHALAGIGALVFLGTFGYLAALGLTTEYVAFHPQVLVSVVVLATVIATGLWAAVGRAFPVVNAGTGRIGLVVLWGHAIDGVANVIAADWLGLLGVNLVYTAKHPANRFIIDVTESVLPQSVLAATGSSWPFLVVKMVVALGVVWIFDEQIFEENPRYAVLLLIAILAVGLGPGSRDMIRATFGI